MRDSESCRDSEGFADAAGDEEDRESMYEDASDATPPPSASKSVSMYEGAADASPPPSTASKSMSRADTPEGQAVILAAEKHSERQAAQGSGSRRRESWTNQLGPRQMSIKLENTVREIRY